MVTSQIGQPDLEAQTGVTATDVKETYETEDSRTDASPVNSKSNEKPHEAKLLTFVRRRDHYVAPRQRLLRNSLLAAVGYLELANALDFPANVWNTIPVPTFAVVLMAIGGSIALIMSLFAFRDLHLSRLNICILRRERLYLHNVKLQREKDRHASLMIDSWLALNLRELGWEITDRVLLDFLVGISSIMVGTGTILAIGGANPRVFRASNLLSGYIGNSFVAFYGLINACWSIFVWRRFEGHKTSVAKMVQNDAIMNRTKRHGRRHQRYAVLNGMFTLVASVGSLMSATLWYGYVVLIPCIISSIYANFLWRHSIGYDRESVNERVGRYEIDIVKNLKFAIAFESKLKEKPQPGALLEWLGNNNEKSRSFSVIQLLLEQGFYEDFCLYILGKHVELAEQLFGPLTRTIAVDVKMLTVNDRQAQINEAAMKFLLKYGVRKFRHRERVLLELLGYYSHASMS